MPQELFTMATISPLESHAIYSYLHKKVIKNVIAVVWNPHQTASGKQPWHLKVTPRGFCRIPVKINVTVPVIKVAIDLSDLYVDQHQYLLS